MLRKSGTSSVSPRGRRTMWTLALLDVMTAVWMSTAGDWFDKTSWFTSVVSLGGHHVLVLALAIAGFLILAAVATLTGGFAEVNPIQSLLIAVAGVVSVVALAGPLSVVALVVGVVLLVALLGKSFL